MRVFKKKGQIVPKRFVRAVEKKSQHLVKFGCDVEIVGNTIYMLTDGCAIHVPANKYCNTKKNKRRVKGFDFSNIIIDGSKNKSKLSQAVKVDMPITKFTINPELLEKQK